MRMLWQILMRVQIFIEDLDVNSSRLVDIVLSLEDDFDISVK